MWFSKRPSFAKASKGKRIYLDYASAPPVLPEVIAAMREAGRLFGNPGAIHAEGVAAKRSLDDSRARIAEKLGCKARELVFTSGLTESNNLAIIGFARYLERMKRTLTGTHWIVSAIEHDSVLECFAEIERLGGSVSHVEPDGRGLLLPAAIQEALRKETVFVSVGWANNEIGVVQPLGKIARMLRSFEEQNPSTHSNTSGSPRGTRGTTSSGQARRIIFHTDAGQAPLYLPTVVSSLGVDLLSLGANKLYGPHGIGALYLANRVSLAPYVRGGKQERGLRAGTETVALSAGFAAAFEVVALERATEARRLAALRDEFARQLQSHIPAVVVNGDMKHTLPHMLNVSIPNINSEYITLALDHAGIALSTKSACREGEESRSHVVYALGNARDASSSVVLTKEERAQNTLRFSLGRETVAADIQRVVSVLSTVVEKLF